MKISKAEVPEKINIPGAIARQELNFGDATGYGKIAGEYFSLKAGTDIAPLLKGLENDLCQSSIICTNNWPVEMRNLPSRNHDHDAQ